MSDNKKCRKKKSGSKARIYGIVLLLFVGTVLSIQMARLYEKKNNYEQEEASLVKEKEALEDKQKELIRYEEYTKTDDYIEDTAFEKLEMIAGNWIIFKEAGIERERWSLYSASRSLQLYGARMKTPKQLEDTKRFLTEVIKIEKGTMVLMGVSGGSDSVALLSIMDELKDELGIELGVIHVEHGIRGQGELV